MPDDGSKEASWVNDFIQQGEAFTVRGIVGSVNLASPMVEDELCALVSSTPPNLIKGVRWILDCVGPYEDNNPTATHVATKRHNGVDYLRGSEGGYEGEVMKEFENGYRLLEKYNLSFDLQCAPIQLKAAAKLITKYPLIPVVIDHMGKPRMVLGEDLVVEGGGKGEEGEEGGKKVVNPNVVLDEGELEVWREGMKVMAAIPHVYVKISMLGYIIPGWIRTKQREEIIKGLVMETIELFGVERCMLATNWWGGPSPSDSDKLSDVGVGALELLEKVGGWVEGLGEKEKEMLFWGTAKKFYRL